jgi:hypothetical protein
MNSPALPTATSCKTALSPDGKSLVPDCPAWEERLAEAFGTGDGQLALTFLSQAIGAIAGSVAPNPDLANAVIALVADLRPRDSIEAMIGVQTVVGHFRAMDLMARSRGRESYGMGEDALKQAMQLMRLTAKQVEALSRYRNRGQQHMVVEHVHVHEGGQAIVGPVGGGQGR